MHKLERNATENNVEGEDYEIDAVYMNCVHVGFGTASDISKTARGGCRRRLVTRVDNHSRIIHRQIGTVISSQRRARFIDEDPVSSNDQRHQ